MTKEEAKIEREATESASAAITAFLSDGSTATGPEMSFKLFRINTSAPDYDKKNWCGPCWRKDCAWGYVLLILALVYAGVGSYFGYQVYMKYQTEFAVYSETMDGVTVLLDRLDEKISPESAYNTLRTYCLCNSTTADSSAFVSKDAFAQCREHLALNVMGIRKDCRQVVTALQNVGICMDGTTIVSPEAYLELNNGVDAQQVASKYCSSSKYKVGDVENSEVTLWEKIVFSVVISTAIAGVVCFFESLIWVLCFKCSKSLTSSIRGDLICSLVVLGFCCAASVVLGPVFLIVAVIFIVQVTFYFLNKPAIDLCIQLVTESAEVALESPGPLLMYLSLGTMFHMANFLLLYFYTERKDWTVIPAAFVHLWLFEASKNVLHLVNVRCVAAWFYIKPMRQMTDGGELQEMGASRHEKFIGDSPVSAFEDGVDLAEGGRALIEISPDVVTRLGGAEVNACSALVLACTHFFGTVALGSFVKTLLAFVLYLVKQRRRGKQSCISSCLTCCVCCCYKCLDIFTGTLMVRVGVLGDSFKESAKGTSDMIIGDEGMRGEERVESAALKLLDGAIMDDIFDKLTHAASSIGEKTGSAIGAIAAMAIITPMLECEYFFPCLITHNFFTILATGVFGGVLGLHVGRSMMSQATALLESSLHTLIFFWYNERRWCAQYHYEMFKRVQYFQAKRDEQIKKIKKCCCSCFNPKQE